MVTEGKVEARRNTAGTREAEWLFGQESTGEGSSVSYLCSVLLGLLSVMPTVAIFVLQLNLIQRRLDIFYAHATMQASSCSTRSVWKQWLLCHPMWSPFKRLIQPSEPGVNGMFRMYMTGAFECQFC